MTYWPVFRQNCQLKRWGLLKTLYFTVDILVDTLGVVCFLAMTSYIFLPNVTICSICMLQALCYMLYVVFKTRFKNFGKHNRLFVTPYTLHNTSQKTLQNLRYSSLAVCELTHTKITLRTDTPNTQTHTHTAADPLFPWLLFSDPPLGRVRRAKDGGNEWKRELQEEGETVQASEEK